MFSKYFTLSCFLFIILLNLIPLKTEAGLGLSPPVINVKVEKNNPLTHQVKLLRSADYVGKETTLTVKTAAPFIKLLHPQVVFDLNETTVNYKFELDARQLELDQKYEEVIYFALEDNQAPKKSSGNKVKVQMALQVKIEVVAKIIPPLDVYTNKEDNQWLTLTELKPLKKTYTFPETIKFDLLWKNNHLTKPLKHGSYEITLTNSQGATLTRKKRIIPKTIKANSNAITTNFFNKPKPGKYTLTLNVNQETFSQEITVKGYLNYSLDRIRYFFKNLKRRILSFKQVKPST